MYLCVTIRSSYNIDIPFVLRAGGYLPLSICAQGKMWTECESTVNIYKNPSATSPWSILEGGCVGGVWAALHSFYASLNENFLLRMQDVYTRGIHIAVMLYKHITWRGYSMIVLQLLFVYFVRSTCNVQMLFFKTLKLINDILSYTSEYVHELCGLCALVRCRTIALFVIECRGYGCS